MQRYFLDIVDGVKKTFIEGQDYHHITHVMRSKVNDKIIVCNLNGKCYKAIILSFHEKKVEVLLEDAIPQSIKPITIDIAQALIRRERFELMLQKSTELGVSTIYPLLLKNCVVKLDANKEQKKIERWNKITKEASEQSHRSSLAFVQEVTNLQKLDYSSYDVVFVAYEKEQASNQLKTYLKHNTPSKILSIIGPEGGFDPSEITYLSSIDNVVFIGLGPRILRSETASSYLLSVLHYELEMSE